MRRRFFHGFLLRARLLVDSVLAIVLAVVLGKVLDIVIGVVNGVVRSLVLFGSSEDSSPDPDISSKTLVIVLFTDKSSCVSKIFGSKSVEFSETLIFLNGSGFKLYLASPILIMFFKSSENLLPLLLPVDPLTTGWSHGFCGGPFFPNPIFK